MCGLAGIARTSSAPITPEQLLRMAASLQHRGPDGHGWYLDERVGLAHVRLSVVDLAGGAQPLANEDEEVWVVYNGEIYNAPELRSRLSALGHRFRTRCDTEVLVHGYEQWGTGLLDRLNGQFAFALYDRERSGVLLARDRFGVRPLYFDRRRGDLIFASEMKGLLASGEVPAVPDLEGLDEVFTFWGSRAPRTPLLGVEALPPGHFLWWENGVCTQQRYYHLHYPTAVEEDPSEIDTLDELLHEAVRCRMRADVPVGGFLSGGLDSTITCTLAAGMTEEALRTFSIGFADPLLDETRFQTPVAARIGSAHRAREIGDGEIAQLLPEVIYHAETPLVRTGPAPLYLLSKLVREGDVKVVLTGEGADELFLGYDLFKEVVVRRFCARRPGSSRRRRLFERLYPYLLNGQRGGDFWGRFFLDHGGDEDPLFSHLPRFALTSRIKDFYSDAARDALGGFDPLAELRDSLPADFSGWAPLHRAAYLEMETLLPSYLLSSQGDRMAMAHGVESRYPFLDHRLFEFAARLPPRSKLRGLREKEILRRWARGVLPPMEAARPKQPYRAPDIPSFFGGQRECGYVAELLEPAALATSGLFDPARVAGLLRRCRDGRAAGFRESQAFVAILSTQIWFDQLLRPFRAPTALLPRNALVRIDRRPALVTQP